MSDSLTSLLSAVVLLVYWEVRARAARARQDALRDEVRDIAPRVVDQVAQNTPIPVVRPTGQTPPTPPEG